MWVATSRIKYPPTSVKELNERRVQYQIRNVEFTVSWRIYANSREQLIIYYVTAYKYTRVDDKNIATV